MNTHTHRYIHIHETVPQLIQLTTWDTLWYFILFFEMPINPNKVFSWLTKNLWPTVKKKKKKMAFNGLFSFQNSRILFILIMKISFHKKVPILWIKAIWSEKVLIEFLALSVFYWNAGILGRWIMNRKLN